MSGTSAGWSDERRARQSALMHAQNAGAAFRRRKGSATWSAERREAKRAQMLAQNADPAFHAKKLAGIARRPPHRMAPADHVHPIVRGFFRQMQAEDASRERIAEPAGISADAISGWRSRNMPLLDMIDAALGVFDLELAIVPIGTRDQNGFAPRKGRKPSTGVRE